MNCKKIPDHNDLSLILKLLNLPTIHTCCNLIIEGTNMQSLPNQVPPTNYCHGKILRAFPRAQNEPKKTCFARTFRPGSQPNLHKTKARKTW